MANATAATLRGDLQAVLISFTSAQHAAFLQGKPDHFSACFPPPDGSQQLKSPGSCRPGLSVPNLDEFHTKMVANDVPCIQEPKELFGTRLAQYTDPDGLAFSVGEHRNDS